MQGRWFSKEWHKWQSEQLKLEQLKSAELKLEHIQRIKDNNDKAIELLNSKDGKNIYCLTDIEGCLFAPSIYGEGQIKFLKSLDPEDNSYDFFKNKTYAYIKEKLDKKKILNDELLKLIVKKGTLVISSIALNGYDEVKSQDGVQFFYKYILDKMKECGMEDPVFYNLAQNKTYKLQGDTMHITEDLAGIDISQKEHQDSIAPHCTNDGMNKQKTTEFFALKHPEANVVHIDNDPKSKGKNGEYTGECAYVLPYDSTNNIACLTVNIEETEVYKECKTLKQAQNEHGMPMSDLLKKVPLQKEKVEADQNQSQDQDSQSQVQQEKVEANLFDSKQMGASSKIQEEDEYQYGKGCEIVTDEHVLSKLRGLNQNQSQEIKTETGGFLGFIDEVLSWLEHAGEVKMEIDNQNGLPKKNEPYYTPKQNAHKTQAPTERENTTSWVKNVEQKNEKDKGDDSGSCWTIFNY